MKTCIRCGKSKPFNAFHIHGGITKGTGKVTLYRPDCRVCRNAYEKKRQAYHLRVK